METGKMMEIKRKHERGFTLLEVMIVVVILGVLASLMLPSLMGNKDKADRQKAISDIVTLENALEMYKLDNNVYPTTEQGLNALVKKPVIAPVPRNYRHDGYIRRLPKDPWGNPYQLKSPGDRGAVDIYSFGPQGVEGKESINNWTLDE
ncbi:type II secretion system major pseudopilin GspG [Erwinia sp. BNK-24-b]|uniref:type II secretion system major pseudopilin GspG n=1 Tax=Erwinia TaxID=551 RepID=UPI0039BF034C